MFELSNAEAFLANFNPRPEKHGNAHKLAGDIKLQVERSGEDLEHFDSALRGALFRDVATGEQQDLVDGNRFKAVRFPRIGAVGWKEEYPGYELEITRGLGLEEPLMLVDVKLTGFSFQPIEGGSVRITFTAACYPDAEEAGFLCALQQEDVTLTLRSPMKPEAEQPQPDLDGVGDAPKDQLAQAAEQLSAAA